MRKLLSILCVWLAAVNVAHATQCTNNTYGVFTCVQISGLLVQNCGTSTGNIFSITSGTTAFVWTDGTSNQTATSTGSVPSLTRTIPSQVVFNTGTDVLDTIYTGTATSTGTFSITPSCTGSYEMFVVNLASSNGTPTVNCISDTLTTVPGFATSTTAQLTVTADCTSTTTSGFAISGVDWENNEPTANAPFTKVTDVAGEHGISISQITSTGVVSAVWSRGAGGDSYGDGMVVLGDGGGGGGGGATNQGSGGKSGSGGKAGSGE